MGIMPDFWIKKMANEKQMITPFVEKLEMNGVFFLMVFHHMDMMQEYLKTLKYLLMSILLQ